MQIEITRRRVKYLRLQVTATGEVKAVAPLRMSQREIDAFIQQKQNWIQRKQAEIVFARETKPVLPDDELLLHGEHYQVAATLDHTALTVPEKAVVNRRDWYRSYAKNYLSERVTALAEKHGFKHEKISVRDQKTRWGSCSSKGNISLNWRLVQMPSAVCDYVILHELCHTREMNHSVAFWRQVAALMPDYAESVHWLRQHGRQLPD